MTTIESAILEIATDKKNVATTLIENFGIPSESLYNSDGSIKKLNEWPEQLTSNMPITFSELVLKVDNIKIQDYAKEGSGITVEKSVPFNAEFILGKSAYLNKLYLVNPNGHELGHLEVTQGGSIELTARDNTNIGIPNLILLGNNIDINAVSQDLTLSASKQVNITSGSENFKIKSGNSLYMSSEDNTSISSKQGMTLQTGAGGFELLISETPFSGISNKFKMSTDETSFNVNRLSYKINNNSVIAADSSHVKFRTNAEHSIDIKSESTEPINIVSPELRWVEKVIQEDGTYIDVVHLLSKELMNSTEKAILYGISSTYALKSEIPNLTGYATQTWVQDQNFLKTIPNTYALKSDIPNVDSFITSDDLPDYSDVYQPKGNYLTEHQSLSEYAKKSELFSKDYNDLTNKPNIPSITGLISEATADNKYQPKGTYLTVLPEHSHPSLINGDSSVVLSNASVFSINGTSSKNPTLLFHTPSVNWCALKMDNNGDLALYSGDYFSKKSLTAKTFYNENGVEVSYVNHTHDCYEGYYYTNIDATNLDLNTWYPVTIPILGYIGKEVHIKVEGLTQKPSQIADHWCNHSEKICVHLSYSTLGSGWGFINPDRFDRIITRYVEGFTVTESGTKDGLPILCNLGQLINTSEEYVFVRGGASYNFYISKPVTPILHSTIYNTSADLSIAPISNPEEIVKISSLNSLESTEFFNGFIGTTSLQTTAAILDLTGISSISNNDTSILLESNIITNTVGDYLLKIKDTGEMIWDGEYYALSDQRMKENIKNISDSIVEFTWKHTGLKSYGFIALSLEKNYPELVSISSDGTKSVNYNAALALTIAKLENRIKELEEKYD